MGTTSTLVTPPLLSAIPNSKTPSSLKTHNSCLFSSSPLSLSTSLSRRTSIENPLKTHKRNSRFHAISGDALPSEVNPVETAQQIVTSGDERVSTIISSLLFIAFIGLSVLTIGVIYIAVTDFMQKKAGERFEKEEEAKKKKGGKKGIKTRARTGPRGFGQKIEEEDDDYE